MVIVILQQLKMDVMCWSSKSTDLNPTEHVCNEPNEDLKQATPNWRTLTFPENRSCAIARITKSRFQRQWTHMSTKKQYLLLPNIGIDGGLQMTYRCYGNVRDYSIFRECESSSISLWQIYHYGTEFKGYFLINITFKVSRRDMWKLLNTNDKS
jgi:hypothetical protein